MSGSLLADALGHHVWASERLIDACDGLTQQQLETATPGTFGPIIATLRHLVATDVWYLTFFPVEQHPPIDEAAETSLRELRSVMTRNGGLWSSVLADAVDGDVNTVEHGDGWEFHAPVGLRLAQVVHHGTDHRSQVCTALATLGLEPPAIDLWAYGEATGRTKDVQLG